MFLRPYTNSDDPQPRRPRRRPRPPTDSKQPTLLRHLARPARHNGDLDELPVDVITMLVAQLLKKPRPTHHWRKSGFDAAGYLTARQLSHAFRVEADRQVDVLLATLRTPLVALRAAFDEHLEEKGVVENQGWPAYHRAVKEARYVFVHGITRAEAHAGTPYEYHELHRAYGASLSALFPYFASSLLEKNAFDTAQWTSRTELVAWGLMRCLGCNTHLAERMTQTDALGHAFSLQKNFMHERCIYEYDFRLSRTALCGACEHTSISGWGHRGGRRPRAIDYEYDAVSRETKTSALRVWMRPFPGIPADVVFGHGLTAARTAELVAAAAAERRAQAAAKRARAEARRARRRERALREREAVFEDFEFRLSHCVFYTTPNFAMDIDRAHEALREAGLELEQYRHTADELATLSSQDIDRIVVSFGRALKQLRRVQPEICGVSTAALLADADAHLAHTAPHLTRLDVYMAERRLCLPSALPVYAIAAYEGGAKYDQWTTTAEADRLLAIFKANAERASHVVRKVTGRAKPGRRRRRRYVREANLLKF